MPITEAKKWAKFVFSKICSLEQHEILIGNRKMLCTIKWPRKVKVIFKKRT